MKKSKVIAYTGLLICTIAIVYVLLLAGSLCVFIFHRWKDELKDEDIARQLFVSAGPSEELIIACHSMIANLRMQVNEGKTIFSIIDIPPIIMRLRPYQVNVHLDHVEVYIKSPGGRTCLNIFNTRAEEFGTSMLTNGVWYWNYKYDITNSTKEAYIRYSKNWPTPIIEIIPENTNQL